MLLENYKEFLNDRRNKLREVGIDLTQNSTLVLYNYSMHEEILREVEKQVQKLILDSDRKYEYMYSHLKWVRGASEYLYKEIMERSEYKEKPDLFIVRLSVWLHDTGVLLEGHKDHDIHSEIYTRQLLANLGVSQEIIEKVAHAVRTHRNRDVKPQTIEARILCAADSAAHFLSKAYIELINQQGTENEYLAGKLTRDARDMGFFPFLEEKMKGLVEGWKKVVNNFPYDLMKFVESDPPIYEGEPSTDRK